MSRLCHDSRVNAPASARSHANAPRTHRVRLDQLIVDRGLAQTRARAQALILGGKVRTGEGDAGRVDRKAGDLVAPDIDVVLMERDPFVSRGGHKLVAALDAFDIDPRDAVCLDVGASTGGFTDALLQRGARLVYALDVGRGQLAESLRRDPRVVSMERTNARTITSGTLPEPVTLATIDVSFISLRLVLDSVCQAFGPRGGSIIALVKPQFEAGRGQVPGGVVRDPAVHRATVDRVVAAAIEGGLFPRDVIPSPILGPEGNREFLLHLDVVGSSAAAVPRPAIAPDLDDRIAAATASLAS